MSFEKEIGVVNGWRYVVIWREGGGSFWVYRKSLSMADHGRREEFVACQDTGKKAEEAARRHMELVFQGAKGYWGDSAPILYTDK